MSRAYAERTRGGPDVECGWVARFRTNRLQVRRDYLLHFLFMRHKLVSGASIYLRYLSGLPYVAASPHASYGQTKPHKWNLRFPLYDCCDISLSQIQARIATIRASIQFKALWESGRIIHVSELRESSSDEKCPPLKASTARRQAWAPSKLLIGIKQATLSKIVSWSIMSF